MMIYNCIVVFNKEKDKILFCKRRKEPYKGLYNFVGGKREINESSETAAYRELYEETGLSRDQIRLFRFMDIRYYHPEFILELYVGIVEKDIILREEVNPLVWMPVSEDFTDSSRFAGEQNIAHIVNVAVQYPIPQRTFVEDGIYIGVDGCKDGWIAAVLEYGQMHLEHYNDISSLVEEYPVFDSFLIDMAIGLKNNDSQTRPEEEAKKELGKRSSTVFPIPCRQAVYAEGEEEQKQTNIKILGKSLAKQTIAIIPKIREIDMFLKENSGYKNVILESHPELCFARLNGAVIISRKKEITGFFERKSVLSDYLPEKDLSGLYEKAKDLRCNPDDVIDAVCLAVSAAFHSHGLCETIPKNPEKDEYGLDMMMTVPIRKSI